MGTGGSKYWKVMPLDFVATESGFDDGMGGASNAAGTGESHYVLFGKDGDGVYFEYDDQIHGAIEQVTHISVLADRVVFTLRDRNTITVRKQMADAKWSEFVAGVRGTFPPPSWPRHDPPPERTTAAVYCTCGARVARAQRRLNGIALCGSFVTSRSCSRSAWRPQRLCCGSAASECAMS